ncbi:LysE family translocator [Marinobacterium mangrovicola]|uniref:Threonine/homoserine/homoserine lactone efflux protein n=1 Tax=Marinobacterium mangrovicola TaxID=1476959 RepID=A0A4R1G594_9GAMM|nr:LysE family translocator [Marinobacterium mangrovicola]TCK02668.1 threonine/homoserine/homoserine lactone efflux protein [Marinobacterium mangrovicola]
MSLASALSFLLAIFIFGITPGPGVFALIARALQRGSWSCLPLALGMILSDVVYLVLACLGLAALATHWSEVFTVIRLAGAAYLCYLGWKMWTAPVAPVSDEKPDRRDALHAFTQGFLISASNPKVILFYIAFLPTFMDVTALSGEGIVLASVLTLVGLLSGLMLIAATAAQARRYLRSPRAARGLNRVSGSVMALAGLYLASRH